MLHNHKISTPRPARGASVTLDAAAPSLPLAQPARPVADGSGSVGVSRGRPGPDRPGPFVRPSSLKQPPTFISELNGETEEATQKPPLVADGKTEWLYFQEDVSPDPGHKTILEVNPNGHVGVLTLWNYADLVYRRLKVAGVDCDPQTSPIVALSSFYGRGLSRFFRNLLWNPHITHLLVLGADLSGSGAFLEQLLTGRARKIEHEGQFYWQAVRDVKPPFGDSGAGPAGAGNDGDDGSDGGGDDGGGQVLLADFPLEKLRGRLTLERLVASRKRGIANASPTDPEVLRRAKAFIEQAAKQPPLPASRVDWPLREVRLKLRPSAIESHHVRAPTVAAAWQELLRKLSRFGVPTRDASGVNRRELPAVLVQIDEPELWTPEELEAWHQPLSRKHGEGTLLDKTPSADNVAYFYGHRLRNYFTSDAGTKKDQIDEALDLLKQGKTYIPLSVWDFEKDGSSESVENQKNGQAASLGASVDAPCLTRLVVTRVAERLDLFACFRVHNLADAWLTNVHDLVELQAYLADQSGYKRGALRLFAHHLSLRTDDTHSVEFLLRKAEKEPLPHLEKLSSPPPALSHRATEHGYSLDLWTGTRSFFLEHEGSLAAGLAALEARLTSSEFPEWLSPIATKADACEIGRQLERCRTQPKLFAQDETPGQTPDSTPETPEKKAGAPGAPGSRVRSLALPVFARFEAPLIALQTLFEASQESSLDWFKLCFSSDSRDKLWRGGAFRPALLPGLLPGLSPRPPEAEQAWQAFLQRVDAHPTARRHYFQHTLHSGGAGSSVPDGSAFFYGCFRLAAGRAYFSFELPPASRPESVFARVFGELVPQLWKHLEGRQLIFAFLFEKLHREDVSPIPSDFSSRVQSAQLGRAAGSIENYRPDPQGAFSFSSGGPLLRDLVGTLEQGGFNVMTYEADIPEELIARLLQDDAFSLVSHGVYLGRVLENLGRRRPQPPHRP